MRHLAGQGGHRSPCAKCTLGEQATPCRSARVNPSTLQLSRRREAVGFARPKPKRSVEGPSVRGSARYQGIRASQERLSTLQLSHRREAVGFARPKPKRSVQDPSVRGSARHQAAPAVTTALDRQGNVGVRKRCAPGVSSFGDSMQHGWEIEDSRPVLEK